MKSLFEKIRADPVTAVEEPKPEVDQEAASSENEQHASRDDEGVSKEAQAGVQAIEATTSVWSTSNLILAYIL